MLTASNTSKTALPVIERIHTTAEQSLADSRRIMVLNGLTAYGVTV